MSGRGPGGDRQARMEELKRSLDAPKTLGLRVVPGQVRIDEDGTRVRAIYPDGKKREFQLSDGVAAEGKAEWKKGALVYEEETKAEHSIKRTEKYALSSDGKELTVTVDLDPPGPLTDTSIRRIYVRGEGAGPR